MQGHDDPLQVVEGDIDGLWQAKHWAAAWEVMAQLCVNKSS